MARLGYSTSVDSTYVRNLGEIQSVNFGLTVNDIDVTSTMSKYSQHIPSTVNPGAIGVSLYFDGNGGADAEDLITELKEQRIGTWTIDFPDGQFQCDGYLSSASVNSAVESAVTMDINITLTGEPTFDGN